MEYREKRSIYLQIADHMCENILGGSWRESDRIPSIREMAMETEVNPNTVARSYGFLQEKGVIQNKRGIGYFVTDGAAVHTKEMIKDEFVREELPYLFRRMDLLGISVADLQAYHAMSKERGA
jgi:GntR family transcriptional regulator